LVENVTHIHAGGDELIEDGFDRGDDPAVFSFFEDLQVSNDRDALAQGFTSRLTFVNEEDSSLLFGECDRLAFSEMQF
jgi:hypothetical protein